MRKLHGAEGGATPNPGALNTEQWLRQQAAAGSAAAIERVRQIDAVRERIELLRQLDDADARAAALDALARRELREQAREQRSGDCRQPAPPRRVLRSPRPRSPRARPLRGMRANESGDDGDDDPDPAAVLDQLLQLAGGDVFAVVAVLVHLAHVAAGAAMLAGDVELARRLDSWLVVERWS